MFGLMPLLGHSVFGADIEIITRIITLVLTFVAIVATLWRTYYAFRERDPDAGVYPGMLSIVFFWFVFHLHGLIGVASYSLPWRIASRFGVWATAMLFIGFVIKRTPLLKFKIDKKMKAIKNFLLRK